MSNKELNITDLHEFGFSGIIKILRIKGTFKKFPFYGSILFSFFITVLICILDSDKLYPYLYETTGILIAFFPSLLGFSLGGYALVVGFSNVDLIKKGSETKKHSLYQILNAIFSLSIIFQVFTTILCFGVYWFIKVDLDSLIPVYCRFMGTALNALILFLLLFGSIYSLCLTPYVVTNLFTLSQLNNLHLTIENLKDESKNKIEEDLPQNSNTD